MTTTVIADTPDYQVVEEVINGGRTVSVVPKPGSALANEQVIRDAARLALTTLQAIIDTAPPTVTNTTQAQSAIRNLQVQVKDEARVLRRLVRLLVGDFTGTD